MRTLDPQPHVVVVVPGAMMVRNWLATSLGERLGNLMSLRVTIVTPSECDRDVAEAAGLAWRPLRRAARGGPRQRLRFMAEYVLYLALVFRFNAIAGFRGAEERLKQRWRLRRIAIRDGIPASRWFGWPFPRSHLLYSWLHRLYHSAWQRDCEVERLFDDVRPSLLVLAHIQTHFATPYALTAAARGIPILGVVGSWDQPTTKGPLAPGISRFLAQSRAVADQLVRYHGVAREAIDVIGWVQMDPFATNPGRDRAMLLTELGLPSDARYVLMGSSPERLGHNEPEIARELMRALKDDPDCALVIRCHPNDRSWRERFGSLHQLPRVVILAPELEAIDRLARQIRHAAAVLSPAGSILLDAVALDTPAIALAFENEDEPYYDRLARRYDMEHWADLVNLEGIPLARGHADLARLVRETVANRELNAEGRARLRTKHLDPLDGRAAERTVAAIARAAGVIPAATTDAARRA
jgi:hypothetical protein